MAGAPPDSCRMGHQLKEALQAQGAGPDGVLVEVCVEEPFVWVDIFSAFEPTETVFATIGDKGDAVDHAPALVGLAGAFWEGEEVGAGGRLPEFGPVVNEADLLFESFFGEEAEACPALVDLDLATTDIEGVFEEDHAA